MKVYLKMFYIVTVFSLLNIQTVFGEVKLNGYRAESIVTDFGASSENYVIYSNNQKEDVEYNHKLLYLDGELVANTDVIIINGISYLDSITLKNELGYDAVKNGDKVQVSKDNVKVMTTSDFKENNGIFYIPLREFFETIGYNVDYKGITDQKSNSINPFKVNIYVDKETVETVAEEIKIAENLIKKACLEGLENYKKSMAINLESQGEDINRFNSDFDYIEKSINNLSYIGEVSRYYVFDMNVYRVFYDKVSGDIYFNYDTGLSTHTVILDVNNPHLFTPLFIVG